MRVFSRQKDKARVLVRGVRDWMSVPRLLSVLALSGVLHAMQLSTSLFLLHLYDRVLPSGSLTALGRLMGLAMGLLALFALLDFARGRALCGAGVLFVRNLERRVRDAIERGQAGCRDRRHQMAGDLERVGCFLARAGPAAFLDLLWLPVCLAGMSVIHPLLALYAGAGVMLIAGAAIGADGVLRQGGAPISDEMLAAGALAKALRLMLQFGGIGLGALLVITDAMSAGGMLAAAVILGRVFAVLDAALLHRRSLVAAVEGYERLIRLIDATERDAPARASFAHAF